MIIDFHCHILPDFDDGSLSCDMSLKMLEQEKQQGVERVVLTPHFYRYREEPEHFLKRRREAAIKLVNAMREARGDYPELRLGAEVAMTRQLRYEDLMPFCINNTNTLLLELPFEPMGGWLKDVEAIINQNRVKVVLAHVERFRSVVGKRDFPKIMELRALKQINTTPLLNDGFFSKKQIFRMIQDEQVHILGTDAHNLDTRPVNMGEALKLLSEKGMREHIRRMMKNAEKIT